MFAYVGTYTDPDRDGREEEAEEPARRDETSAARDDVIRFRLEVELAVPTERGSDRDQGSRGRSLSQPER